MSKEKLISVARIRELIDQGFQALKAPQDNQAAVLVIGDTGVGKSTIISLLCGIKLIVKQIGLQTVIDSVDKSSMIKIGHDKYSETSVPTKVVIETMDFFDCSGFRDNRGDEFEISNSFYLQRLFYLYQKVKILLIIDQSYIVESRLEKLPKLFNSLSEAFGDLRDIQDGVVLLINKVKPTRKLKDFTKELMKFINLKGDKNMFSQSHKDFIEYLIDNEKIVLFQQAQESSVGEEIQRSGEDYLTNIKEIEFIKCKKIKNIISDPAKLSIRNFADQLLANGSDKFQQFIKSIKAEITKYSLVVSSSDAELSISQINSLISQISEESEWKIPEIIKSHIPSLYGGQISKDFSTVLFLRDIYQKAQCYFIVLKEKLISGLQIYCLELKYQLDLLKQKEKKIEDMFKDKVEIQEKLIKLLEEKEVIIKSVEAFQTSFKIKEKSFEEYKIIKNNEIDLIRKEARKNQDELELKILEKQEQLKNKESLEETIITLQSEAEENAARIEELQWLVQEQKAMIENSKNELTNTKNQLNSLKESSQLLKVQIQRYKPKPIIKQTYSSYGGCPHFRNGGTCYNCMRGYS